MTTQPSDWAVRTAFLELTEAPAYEVLNTHFREEVLIRARELDASANCDCGCGRSVCPACGEDLGFATPRAAESVERMCVDCGNPTMHAGKYCFQCSKKRREAMGAVGAGD